MKVNDDIGVGQKYVTKRVKSMSFLQISIFLLTNRKKCFFDTKIEKI